MTEVSVKDAAHLDEFIRRALLKAHLSASQHAEMLSGFIIESICPKTAKSLHKKAKVSVSIGVSAT